MKIKTLWHKPCMDDKMSFLVPDTENSIDGFGKFRCMKCGQRNISITDDSVETVIGEPIDLYVIGNNANKSQTLGIDEYQITFASVDQAIKFADEEELEGFYDICEIGEKGPVTNGNEVDEGGDGDGGEEKK